MGWKTHNTYAIANTLAGSGISREARPVPAIQPALLTVPAAWPPAAGARPARAPARPCEPFFVSHPRACSTNFNLILAYSEWLGTSSPVRNPFEWCDNRAVYDFRVSYFSRVTRWRLSREKFWILFIFCWEWGVELSYFNKSELIEHRFVKSFVCQSICTTRHCYRKTCGWFLIKLISMTPSSYLHATNR